MTIGTMKNGYLIVNSTGTQMKLPALKWYWRVWFEIKQGIFGEVSLEEIKKAAYGL